MADWDTALAALPDCNLYQSQAWGRYREAMGWQVVRAIGRDANDAIVAMIQMLVRRRLGMCIIWIPGGPAGEFRLWSDSLIGILRKRFGPLLYCRLSIFSEYEADAGNGPFARAWRRPGARLGSGLSLRLDLRRNDAERMSATSANWRHNLHRSAKYALQVERWRRPDPTQMAEVYREMEGLKGIGQQHSEAGLRAMIDALGDYLLIFRCLDRDGNLLALRAGGIFGDRAWDLLAATTRAGRKVYASHATLWALLAACRQRGALDYDLGGVDPIGNKGVFDFKHGTGARLVEYVGEWEWASAPLLAPAVGLLMKYRGLTA